MDGGDGRIGVRLGWMGLGANEVHGRDGYSDGIVEVKEKAGLGCKRWRCLTGPSTRDWSLSGGNDPEMWGEWR